MRQPDEAIAGEGRLASRSNITRIVKILLMGATVGGFLSAMAVEIIAPQINAYLAPPQPVEVKAPAPTPHFKVSWDGPDGQGNSRVGKEFGVVRTGTISVSDRDPQRPITCAATVSNPDQVRSLKWQSACNTIRVEFKPGDDGPLPPCVKVQTKFSDNSGLLDAQERNVCYRW